MLTTQCFTDLLSHTQTFTTLIALPQPPRTNNTISHYSFYLQDGMSILELGAAEKSYLPSDLKLKKHVGIGAVQEQMDLNPSLTSSMVLDLNDVIDDVGLRKEEEILRTLLNPSTTNGQYDNADDEGFDAIIMANTIDFLISPREVFK